MSRKRLHRNTSKRGHHQKARNQTRNKYYRYSKCKLYTNKKTCGGYEFNLKTTSDAFENTAYYLQFPEGNNNLYFAFEKVYDCTRQSQQKIEKKI